MIVSIKPAYLDREQAAAFVALKESTMLSLVRTGEFPKPRLLSKQRTAWLVRELEEWAEKRPVSDLPPPPNAGQRGGAKSVSMAGQ
ncbi:helix-turn-helix transcriptional regulator [Paracidovorax cattleyae]|uniref:helix-turn-helix transcriptional regulator n=1 Tax=Paracidovorax cattleyae TaxID=80868 RepID=UPI0018AFDF38|nr:AlpA family phage regulatory protein [Paracidovorax cattleyae]MBF9263913.1 AlpA family phage regulatory protein [Paracidovorax cattleyae]UYL85457.1 AlpA family regulatory protein [Acidovorax phage Aval]